MPWVRAHGRPDEEWYRFRNHVRQYELRHCPRTYDNLQVVYGNHKRRQRERHDLAWTIGVLSVLVGCFYLIMQGRLVP